MEEHERIRISGVINDVTFANPENGFTVLELESGDELITAVGVMPELKAGELLELSGYWDFHASFGRQFRVELCEHKMPASAGDILRYLAAGGVKGIGSKLAVKIVDKFGENTLDIIENDPERLAQIRGISPEKAKQISADFKRQFAVREIMISLEKIRHDDRRMCQSFQCVRRARRRYNQAKPLCAVRRGSGLQLRASRVHRRSAPRPAR